MKRLLVLNTVKPLSINSTYYSTGGGFIKTTAAREWTHEVCYHLSSEENEKALADLRQHFDNSKHYYKISLEAHYPKKFFITGKGHISARTVDITNWEKSIIDVIFLPKNYSDTPPYGCKNLNIDDRYICEMSSKKVLSKDDFYRIVVEIEISNLDV